MATKKSSPKKPAASSAKATTKAKSAPKAAAPKARAGSLKLDSMSLSLTANDLAKSLVFYCDTLGFALIQKWEMDGVVRGAELAAGGASVMLGQDDWKKGRTRKKGLGLRFYLMTNQNVEVLAAKLKARGLVLEEEPMTSAWGTHFSFADPDGFKFTIAKEGKKKK